MCCWCAVFVDVHVMRLRFSMLCWFVCVAVWLLLFCCLLVFGCVIDADVFNVLLLLLFAVDAFVLL